MSVSTSSSPTPSKNAMASQKRPIAEIITEKFPPFDHRSAIVEPFDNETKRDAEFMESASGCDLPCIGPAYSRLDPDDMRRSLLGLQNSTPCCSN